MRNEYKGSHKLVGEITLSVIGITVMIVSIIIMWKGAKWDE